MEHTANSKQLLDALTLAMPEGPDPARSHPRAAMQHVAHSLCSLLASLLLLWAEL